MDTDLSHLNNNELFKVRDALNILDQFDLADSELLREVRREINSRSELEFEQIFKSQ